MGISKFINDYACSNIRSYNFVTAYATKLYAALNIV